MFEGKPSGRMQNKLSDVLRRILSADFKFLVDIKSDDLGNEFQRALVPKELIPKELTPKEHEKWTLINLYELSLYLFSCVLHNRDHIFNSCQNTSIPKVRSKLYMIKCKLRVTEHSLTETQEALSFLLPYIDTTWMSVQVVEAKHSSVSSECIYDLLTSEKWHMISLESDMFSSTLKQASLMFMLGYHELSLDILLGLQDKIEQELPT